MKQERLQEYNEERYDEIDIREILSTLLQYRKSLLFFVLLFTGVASYIAYFKPSIYSAKTQLKITSDRQGYYKDFLMVSSEGGNAGIEDELIVFKSRPIAKKALEKLNLGIRYYSKKNFRTVELYKNAPFTVTHSYLSSKIYGKKCHVIPVDEGHFRLEVGEKRSLWQSIKEAVGLSVPQKGKIEYTKVHQYDEQIQTKWFVIQVHKIYELQTHGYWFTMLPNEAMVGFVQGGISTSNISKFGNIVSLSFRDTVPQRATDIINRVAEAYIEQNLELKSQGAKKQLYFIDMQLEAINKTLKGSAEKLQRYKATNIVVNLSNKAQLTASKLSQYESTLYEVNMQLDILENMSTHLSKEEKQIELTFDTVQESNPLIATLIKEIQKSMARYAVLSVSYTENHPAVLKLKQEIMFLKKSLKETLRNSIATLSKQKKRLLHVIAEQENRLKNVPQQEQQLEKLSRHFMVNEKIYSYLLEKRAETAILASSTISHTRLIEKALVPSSPVKPNRKLIVLVGFILGILMGVIQVFLRTFFNNTIMRNEDVEHSTTVPLYATLPLIKTNTQLPSYLEAIRSLWINLAFIRSKNKSKVISVTSSISGEGKTFTLYHLSKILAKSSEYKVIAIDMDMRRATLHDKFEMKNREKGISTILSGSHNVEETIVSTSIENLDVILSGPKAPNPTRLIMSDAFDTMIETLSKEYDYILIDTPPIGIVSDAMKIMHHSDLVLFMLKVGYSKKEFIKTINQLDRYDEINMGIVLNGMEYEKSYYHGYKHKYAERYYHNETDTK